MSAGAIIPIILIAFTALNYIAFKMFPDKYSEFVESKVTKNSYILLICLFYRLVSNSQTQMILVVMMKEMQMEMQMTREFGNIKPLRKTLHQLESQVVKMNGVKIILLEPPQQLMKKVPMKLNQSKKPFMTKEELLLAQQRKEPSLNSMTCRKVMLVVKNELSHMLNFSR